MLAVINPLCVVTEFNAIASVTVFEFSTSPAVVQFDPPSVLYCNDTFPEDAEPIEAVQVILMLYFKKAGLVEDGVNVVPFIGLVTAYVEAE